MAETRAALHTSLKRRSRLNRRYLFTVLAVLLPGCAFKPTPAANPIPAAPFLAGAVPTASVETLAAPTAAITSSPQACANGLTYLNDLTIPDGSEIQPGATIDKRWEVQNSGTCNWDETYALQLIAGDAMEAGTTRALIPARSGATISLRILFRAPETPGDYRTAWQAYSPDGEAFGDPVYMEIRVSEP